jgi:hypothetical protein
MQVASCDLCMEQLVTSLKTVTSARRHFVVIADMYDTV